MPIAAPAGASRTAVSPALTYVEARAAATNGDHRRSAGLLAALAATEPGNSSIAARAIGEAVTAGEMKLALGLIAKAPTKALTMDARLLLAAEDLRRGRSDRALAQLRGDGDQTSLLGAMVPLLQAWQLAERRDPAALRVLDALPAGNPFAGYLTEQRAFLLLRLGRAAEARPYAERALTGAAGREARLRLAFADAYIAAGDRDTATAFARQLGPEYADSKARIAAGKSLGESVDTPAKAYAEMLMALAVDLSRLNNDWLPISIVQVARYAAPDSDGAAVLLGVFLAERDRVDEALAAFGSVPDGAPLGSRARDYESKVLVEAQRLGEALALARRVAARPAATAVDYARLGDILGEMKRYGEAADAYGRALAMGPTAPPSQRWPLHYLRASMLEEAGRWPEARAEAQAGLRLAPDQPVLLNFLGYTKLERGEDLDAAEAMIRKASALVPDNASITDSLGWALFKRGRVQEAITTLQAAAAADPEQPEINEHLGDALYKAGRRIEARFAWNAALLSAEEEVASRIKAKLEWGLTPATAAP